MATIYCGTCGNEVAGGVAFCGACGAPVERPPEPELEHEPVAARPIAAGTRRRVSPVLVVGGLVVLVALVGAVVLLLNRGDDSTISDRTFAREVNENVLGPLGRADRIGGDVASLSSDGNRIVRAADNASRHLRGLNGLSAPQEAQVKRLLAFVAANRVYGQALARYTPGDDEAQLALDRAAAAARATLGTSGLSAELQLPSRAVLATPAPPTPPTTTVTTITTTAAPAPADAAAYVRQVDSLLLRSRAVVLGLRSFVPRASNDTISRAQAVTLAGSYLAARQQQLAEARALTVPPAFATPQRLLIRSLTASVGDDQALVEWTVARRAGSGDAQAAFDRANRLGTRASALKQEFLRAYGPPRQLATGRTPASLPDVF